MAKYKVGDELILVNDPTKEKKKLKELTRLKVEDGFAQLSWGIQIINVEYDAPNVTLTYKNFKGEENKVFAVCQEVENFDQEKVLEKALLKAFLNEIIDLSVIKNISKK
ncbi:MAG: hypothetical protein MR274_01065 [Clostridium sp.]|nr:hypothetical protein [Clostridium sp.]MDY3827408.1 hypothetical protein [Clostridium sp.]